MKIKFNPYANIDFARANYVRAISHEHLYGDKLQVLKNAYNRGIRIFAFVNYLPAVPSFPISGWDSTFEDYISEAEYPKTTTKHYKGSIPTFTDKDGNVIDTDTLPQICNAEHIQMPYVHTPYPELYVEPGHQNVLGNKWGEPSHWTDEGISREWRAKHRIFSIEEACAEYVKPENQQFAGKIFGTINHTGGVKNIEKLHREHPEVWKAMELFNQGYSVGINKGFRDAFDYMLSKGYVLFGTSVVDWQDCIEEFKRGSAMTVIEYDNFVAKYNALSDSEKNQYVDMNDWYKKTQRECTFDRGCNVLLYDKSFEQLCAEDNTPQRQKIAESAMDKYLAGEYFASGFGNHRIVRYEPQGNKIAFEVSDSPSKIVLITDSERIELTNTNKVEVSIKDTDHYVRGEAYYYNNKSDMDFIFTNPIFFEAKKKDSEEEILLLLD